MHQKIISKFNECWIPDFEGEANLSGILGHTQNIKTPIKYLGPLSRFKAQDLKNKYNLLVILSGPEPQRTLLEEKLFIELKSYKGKVCFIKGVIESQQTKTQQGNMTIYNYMTSTELEQALNESELVLSRSGYTTIMDLAKLGKSAFFIPTPGQFEQEYLAKKMKSESIAPYYEQDKFTIELLSEVKNYDGFNLKKNETDYKDLFRLF